MLYVVLIVLLVLVALLLELRLRRPDQLVLTESGGKVVRKKSRFYLRHFALPVSNVLFTLRQYFDTEAAGKLRIKIETHLTVLADQDNLDNLVHTGGWRVDMVERAAAELQVRIEQVLKDYCEDKSIEQLYPEELTAHVAGQFNSTVPELGLKINLLHVRSAEPLDEHITAALRQREAIRLEEESQREEWQAKVTTARAKNDAQEKIAQMEHKLELKKIDLREKALEQESRLDARRTEEEIKRREMQLDFERRELEMLKDSPELLLLSPQLTRLAEAGQPMKNARTVVNLSTAELEQGAQLAGTVQGFLQNMLQRTTTKKNKK